MSYIERIGLTERVVVKEHNNEVKDAFGLGACLRNSPPSWYLTRYETLYRCFSRCLWLWRSRMEWSSPQTRVLISWFPRLDLDYGLLSTPSPWKLKMSYPCAVFRKNGIWRTGLAHNRSGSTTHATTVFVARGGWDALVWSELIHLELP